MNTFRAIFENCDLKNRECKADMDVLGARICDRAGRVVPSLYARDRAREQRNESSRWELEW